MQLSIFITDFYLDFETKFHYFLKNDKQLVLWIYFKIQLFEKYL